MTLLGHLVIDSDVHVTWVTESNSKSSSHGFIKNFVPSANANIMTAKFDLKKKPMGD